MLTNTAQYFLRTTLYINNRTAANTSFSTMEPPNKKIKGVNYTSGDEHCPAAAAEDPIEVMFVPTKTYDGGSSPKTTEEGTDKDAFEPQDPKRKDSFLYYSNDANRLSYLLLHRDDDQEAAPAGEHQPPITRKTRLSFEVHPDLLLADMFFNAAAFARQEDAVNE